jgi:hypothetical protein
MVMRARVGWKGERLDAFHFIRRAAAAKDDETREERRGEERTGREAWESGGVGEEGRWVRARGDAS